MPFLWESFEKSQLRIFGNLWKKRNERDTLDNYLRQALDDRQVFEKRSYEVLIFF